MPKRFMTTPFNGAGNNGHGSSAPVDDEPVVARRAQTCTVTEVNRPPADPAGAAPDVVSESLTAIRRTLPPARITSPGREACAPRGTGRRPSRWHPGAAEPPPATRLERETAGR